MRVNRYVLFAVLAGLALTPPVATAQITVLGSDVQPVDNPFTLLINEGLQADGATVAVGTFASPTDADGNLTDADGIQGQPFFEQNLNVVIGEFGFGEVGISGGAILRNGHLVLGGTNTLAGSGIDSSVVGANIEFDMVPVFDSGGAGVPLTGAGTLRISGPGSTFNNHPQIIPRQFQSAGDPSMTSFNIPATFNFGDLDGDGNDEIQANIMRDAASLFDAYIGFTSSGLLEITDGGIAEIQDGVVIGFGPQAVGEVLVSGSGSTLQGFGGINPADGMTPMAGGPTMSNTISQFVVGGFGNGSLAVEEGGLVQAFQGAAIGVLASSGDRGEVGTEDPDDFGRGGRGTVLVDGQNSRWDIFVAEGTPGAAGVASTASALAIGEFVATEGDAASSFTPTYEDNAGQGTLTISNQGLVRLIDPDDANNAADLRIGRFGELTLQTGGEIEVDGDIFNDGVISGDGAVLTGTFVNRSLGEVLVGSGETLTIRSDGDDAPGGVVIQGTLVTAGLQPDGMTAIGTPNDFFAANFGSLQVTGEEGAARAEFVFERADATAPTAGDIQRFWNARRNDGGVDDQFGEIIASNAVLRFRAGSGLADNTDGLLNDGIVAIVAGENLVTGTVENTALGVVNVQGSVTETTSATFADGLINNGITSFVNADVVLLPGSAAYSGAGTLALSGATTVSVNGSFELGDGMAGGTIDFVSTNGFTPTLTINGDFTFDTAASISLDSVLLADAELGDIVNLITVNGAINALTGDISGLISDLPVLADPDLVVNPIVDTSGALVLQVVSISGTGAFGASGADFNGDGIVDNDDLDVFSMFFGLESGGTALTGDANGDGAVDALDFFLIQQQFGGAPVPALVATTVPEPAALTLALVCLTAAGRRRRG